MLLAARIATENWNRHAFGSLKSLSESKKVCVCVYVYVYVYAYVYVYVYV